MAKKKNMDNVVDQAVSLEEEVLQKDREIAQLKKCNYELSEGYWKALADQYEAAVENDARVLKYKVATMLSTVVAVVALVVNVI